jgi:hypothetical protein
VQLNAASVAETLEKFQLVAEHRGENLATRLCCGGMSTVLQVIA